jgi:type II secretory pathway predicted ATPase ExeA
MLFNCVPKPCVYNDATKVLGMYYDFFGLIHPPYRITPDTQLFYSGADRGDILQALIYAIQNGEAITKVVGEVGTGKTMLCRMLEHKLPEHIEVVYLPNPNIPRENILHALAFEVGLSQAVDPEVSRLELTKAFEAYLLHKHANHQQVVVFVEEAQSMPLETLEEIRLLSNLETQQHKLLQVVLFGQPELDENLAAPHVRQIKERITNSLYLPPLKVADVPDYLMFRMHLAGYNGPELFTAGATRLIARGSRGLLRRINILADKALLAAFSQNSRVVTRKHVAIAIRDCDFATLSHWYRPSWVASLLVGMVLGAAGISVASLGTQPRVEQLGTVVSKPSGKSVLPRQAVSALSKLTPAVDGETSRVETGTHNSEVNITSGSLLKSRMEQTHTWLAKQDPERFSIQVLLADADATQRLEHFFSQKSLRNEVDRLFVVQSTVNDKPMLFVFYGDYATYDEANSALLALPEGLSRYQPYLRRLRGVMAMAGETVRPDSLEKTIL